MNHRISGPSPIKPTASAFGTYCGKSADAVCHHIWGSCNEETHPAWISCGNGTEIIHCKSMHKHPTKSIQIYGLMAHHFLFILIYFPGQSWNWWCEPQYHPKGHRSHGTAAAVSSHKRWADASHASVFDSWSKSPEFESRLVRQNCHSLVINFIKNILYDTILKSPHSDH